MTRNNLEQFSESSPSNFLLSVGSWGTFTVSCSSCRWVLFYSAFLLGWWHRREFSVFEFSAADCSKAFGKSLQQVAGVVHILGESWSSPSLEVDANVWLETSEKHGTG